MKINAPGVRSVWASLCVIDSKKLRDLPKVMHQKNRNTRKTVGTRLYRVRHSWNRGPGLINHGRDTIGSLPYCTYYTFLMHLYWRISHLLEVVMQGAAPTHLALLCVFNIFVRDCQEADEANDQNR